ncbi:hypothetical protein DQ04_00661100 [Trypanosoma grayi]|uniref:hypothetical protein n=1 Tax=Trypanosoma grayi TaxID=71804 RepID=UPI0004F3F507|nr:hypothetical protein DQ04_00661100 [Trypanosoma grayi]KEG14032.1 hypothetical protein DQ04_00661100 [Trypanosoma grayi]
MTTKLQPPLGAAKQENHRMLLSRACGCLAEVLVKVHLNAPGNLMEYSDVMYSTLSFFLGDYSRCNEQRVRVVVAYALGCTFAVCSDEKKIELAGKVVSLVVQGLKREKPQEASFPLRGMTALFSCVTDTVRMSL